MNRLRPEKKTNVIGGFLWGFFFGILFLTMLLPANKKEK